MWSSPPTFLPPVTTRMNRSLLHGAPVRGNAAPPLVRQDKRPSRDVRSSQDARSNLAIQPAANASTLKLKKNAVKIICAANPGPTEALLKAPSQPIAPAAKSLSTSVPSSALVTSAMQQSNKENATPTALDTVTDPPAASSPFTDPTPDTESPSAKGSLDDMFARLSATTNVMPSRPAKQFSSAGLDKSIFSFEDQSDTIASMTKTLDDSTTFRTQVRPPQTSALQGAQQLQDWSAQTQKTLEPDDIKLPLNSKDLFDDELEQEYLRKAVASVSALPASLNHSEHTVKAVISKLQNAYTPDTSTLRQQEVEKLRARCEFAVVNYVNKRVTLNPEPLKGEFVMKVLRDNSGSLLNLCATLVETGHIALDNLEQITGLCRNILDILPKVEDVSATQDPRLSEDGSETGRTTQSKLTSQTAEVAPRDLLDDMKTWPTQEKREHGAIHRACVLKGVSEVQSLNELQALVWGGRLESISMPEPGSEHALVKFLTPEACQAYLNATENGIEVQGGTKKNIIFVDKQPGPTSISDVIQNCIDGHASRCVRATGADDDWSDGALFKLARGKQQIKRDVDRIKQGKTARGHHYIEFRFGNIYHALNFRRHLANDEEWEHCSIGYAPDPCELAKGVHYKDADEEGGGSFV